MNVHGARSPGGGGESPALNVSLPGLAGPFRSHATPVLITRQVVLTRPLETGPVGGPGCRI